MTADEAVGRIVSDPERWLWSVGLQVELFRVLPQLWVRASDASRAALMAKVLGGPSRRLYRDDLPENEWSWLRSRSIWELLIRLSRTEVPLPEEGNAALQRIEGENPEWKLGGERDDFPVWSGPTETSVHGESHPSIDFLRLSVEERCAVLSQSSSLATGVVAAWKDYASRDPDGFVDTLEALSPHEGLDRRIWTTALNLEASEGPLPEWVARMIGLLVDLRDGVLSDILPQAVDFLRRNAEGVANEVKAQLLSVWDRLFPRAMLGEVAEQSDRLTQALNHPAGGLGDVLVRLLHAAHLERNAGLPMELRTRFQRVLEESGDCARLARIIVGSRLAVLHNIDPDWTVTHLLPFFDWRGEADARGAWQGFLWSPFIQPSLWPHLKPSFLSTFEHIHALDDTFIRQLASVVASLAVDGKGLLTIEETRRCLRSLPHSGRAAVAWWVWRKLKDAGDRAPILWRERMSPSILKAWPRELAYRSPQVSERFAEAASFAGEAFPTAVRAIEGFLVPVQWPSGLFKRLRESGLSKEHAEETLVLLYRLVDEETFLHGQDFRGLLGDLLHGQPSLEEDPRYRRINEIAIRARL